MSLGAAIRSGASWLLFANLSNQAMQFVIGVVLARLLTPADFGMIVTIQIFTGLASLVAAGGMGQALIREKSVEPRDFHLVFTTQLLIGFGIYALFFVTAPLIAASFGDPLYTDLIRISTFTFLTRPFNNLPSVILSREMRYKEASKIGLTAGLGTGVAGILMAWSGMGVWSLVLSGFVGAAVNITLLMRLTGFRPHLIWDPASVRRFAGFGAKISANDIASYARRQSANFVISGQMGAYTVGLYNKGDSLAEIPFFTVGAALYEALFRALSKVQDDLPETLRLFMRSITMLVVLTLPLYVGMYWLAEPFIVSVYGAKWREAAQPLAILACSGLFTAMGMPAGAVLAAQNMLGRELVVQSALLVTTLLAIFLGMRWGMSGIAVGIVVARGFAMVHILWVVRQRLPLTLPHLIHAAAPGVGLALLMISAFWLADLALPAGLSQTHPFAYTMVNGACGVMAYSVGFLFLPIPALAGERERWRRTLRLSPSGG